MPIWAASWKNAIVWAAVKGILFALLLGLINCFALLSNTVNRNRRYRRCNFVLNWKVGTSRSLSILIASSQRSIALADRPRAVLVYNGSNVTTKKLWVAVAALFSGRTEKQCWNQWDLIVPLAVQSFPVPSTNLVLLSFAKHINASGSQIKIGWVTRSLDCIRTTKDCWYGMRESYAACAAAGTIRSTVLSRSPWRCSWLRMKWRTSTLSMIFETAFKQSTDWWCSHLSVMNLTLVVQSKQGNNALKYPHPCEFCLQVCRCRSHSSDNARMTLCWSRSFFYQLYFCPLTIKSQTQE
jgi:hypothetical protein